MSKTQPASQIDSGPGECRVHLNVFCSRRLLADEFQVFFATKWVQKQIPDNNYHTMASCQEDSPVCSNFKER